MDHVHIPAGERHHGPRFGVPYRQVQHPRAILRATLVFALGTLLCAAAPDFLFLIIGRVLQAAGSGVLMPLVSVVPMLVFPVEKRGTAMGMAGIVMSAVPRSAPS